MDFIPLYIRGKKNPDGIVYDHPLLKPILSVTYGCIVYQEQVMSIVRELGGYSLGRADILRRIMSKKKAESMKEEKDIFINGKLIEGAADEDGPDAQPKVAVPGALRMGIPIDIAERLFDQMAKFASYAFNKSHAAAYAYLSYQTAYLKRYYPVHYLTAVLNNRILNSDETTKYIGILKENKIDIYPPDINKSDVYFSVEGGGVRFGLMGIKNIGEIAISAIVNDRKANGAFLDIVDFVRRCDQSYINKRMLESLIKGGAMDCFGKTRSQLMSVYERVVDAVSSDKKNKESGQISMFDEEIEEMKIGADYPDIGEFRDNIKLTHEKEVLGMYISGHPLNDYLDEFKKLSFNMSMITSYDANDEISDGDGNGVQERRSAVSDGDYVTAGGVLTGFSKKITKNGRTMASAKLEDLYGTVEVVFFPSQYEKCKQELANDIILKVIGVIRLSEEENPRIIVNDIVVWSRNAGAEAEASNAVANGGLDENADGAGGTGGAQAKQKTLYIKIENDFERTMKMLGEIFSAYRGDCKVKVQFDNILYDTGFLVNYSSSVRWELKSAVKSENIKYVEK
jgi:DNA polymerase-3 subunit alpha